jgi:hypothetical protein
MQPQTDSYHREVGQGCTNARHRVYQVTKFCIVVLNPYPVNVENMVSF